MTRPTGSNADEWAAFIDEHRNAIGFLSCQIACAIEDASARAPSAPLGDAAEVVKELRACDPYAAGGQAKAAAVEVKAAALIEALQADNARLTTLANGIAGSANDLIARLKASEETAAALQARLDRVEAAATSALAAIDASQYPAIVKHLIAALPDSAEVTGDGWIEWKGGECPVPSGTRIIARLRCGREEGPEWAGNCAWQHNEIGADIMSYKLAEVKK